MGAILYLGVTLSTAHTVHVQTTSGDHSVIVTDSNSNTDTIAMASSTTSDKSMTGMTVSKGKILFKGRICDTKTRVSYVLGAGMRFLNTACISATQSERQLYNNTTHEHGGAIQVSRKGKL